ncbi:MAG: carboxypeptidase M32 [Solirubrobacterales bacterium]|nr:carboxypeptidase M32 [Solirubrobacterales bacterium]
MAKVSDELLEMLGEISDLGRARELLAWDEHTKMPPRGAAARAEQIATLTRLRHRRLASDELGRLLDAAEATLEGARPDSFAASLVRVSKRDWEKARRVPAELRAEIARTTALAEHTWEAARAESDFGAFLPSLERVIELKRRYLECFEFDHPYDPLLDDFEPEMKTAELGPLLARVRDGVGELLAEIAAAGTELDASPLFGSFPPGEQEALAQDVAARLPLEPDSWRLDSTVHPFATGIAISDLRITTRFDPGYVGTALWSVIHEVGHAMYNNGIDPELARTPLCRSTSMGFDESQSRLWENWVGRGRPFLGHLLPLLAERFPERFAGLEAEELYRAANRVGASPIRVEADEVTYNLHIVLRFELELALFEERIAPRELPEAWRERTREYLGIEVADDAAGVLQDVHWAAGLYGYFPTYCLGNMIAAQVWEGARAELADLDDQLARGELAPLRDHLRERIYRHGAKLAPTELIEAVTGGPLDPGPLIAGLRRKYGELYELG